MGNPFKGFALVLLSVLLFSPVAFAQFTVDRSNAATKSLPFDPHDLTGVWSGQGGDQTTDEPPMTPYEETRYKSEKNQFSNPPALDASDTDPLYHCDPVGIPRAWWMAWPTQIVQTPTEVVLLFNMHQNYIEAYLNAKHPEHPGKNWFGDSVAHWDGNTLVIDTVGFNDRPWLDRPGHTHSDQMHLVERFTRIDHDHMLLEYTVDDPKAYTEPWGREKMFVLDPNGDFDEYICAPSDEQQVIQKVLTPEAAPKVEK
jgi:hypothetical protein